MNFMRLAGNVSHNVQAIVQFPFGCGIEQNLSRPRIETVPGPGVPSGSISALAFNAAPSALTLGPAARLAKPTDYESEILLIVNQ